MRKLTISILILIAGLLQAGCDLINPAEGIPTYVQIDSFSFSNPNPGLTGTGRQAINSVWVYLDGESIGVFELPATIPVLLSSKRQLQLAPGVDNQGLKDYKLPYPFFSFYNIDIEPKPGEIVKLQPETKYISDLKFWHSDFESGNVFAKLSGDTSIRIVRGQDSVLEGGAAGCISLGNGLANAESTTLISSFSPGTQGYLEFNYKGNLSFQVGILVILSSGTQYSYLAGIKAKEEWGKFYLDINQYTAQYSGALGYSVLIKSSLEEGQTGGYVLLDNIKAVWY
jgi:hypothetical protein